MRKQLLFLPLLFTCTVLFHSQPGEIENAAKKLEKQLDPVLDDQQIKNYAEASNGG